MWWGEVSIQKGGEIEEAWTEEGEGGGGHLSHNNHQPTTQRTPTTANSDTHQQCGGSCL